VEEEELSVAAHTLLLLRAVEHARRRVGAVGPAPAASARRASFNRAFSRAKKQPHTRTPELRDEHRAVAEGLGLIALDYTRFFFGKAAQPRFSKKNVA